MKASEITAAVEAPEIVEVHCKKCQLKCKKKSAKVAVGTKYKRWRSFEWGKIDECCKKCERYHKYPKWAEDFRVWIICLSDIWKCAEVSDRQKASIIIVKTEIWVH